jgi:hypothetical protein
MVMVLAFRLPAYLIYAAVLGCGCGFAQTTRFFPLKDIRPGLHGTGKTVFSGTRVEQFDVEILGVLENIGPKQNIILARLSGGPLEKTGIIQGMSGSPVYIDNRLVGAVALGFPFSKDPICGIRPIEEMLASTPAPAAAPTARASLRDRSLTEHFPKRETIPALESKLIDIATPVSFTGFTAGTLQQFAPQLRDIGLEPRQGISGGGGPGSGTATNAPLLPGSMISVQLLSGDMSVGADGTVTHIDGKRIYAFGHQFLSVGSTELPFARSNVLALLPNLSSSFKISNSGEWLGAITADGTTAISGELGRHPRTVPLTISVKGTRGTQTYHMEMANDSMLSPLLLQMAMYSTLESTERTLGSGSIAVHGSIQFQGNFPPVHLDNLFSGDFNVPLQSTLSTAIPVAYALQNSLGDLHLKSIDLSLESLTIKRQAQIAQISTSRRTVHPGEPIDLLVVLDGENGRDITRKFTYRVPLGAPEGTLNFTVADGPTANVADFVQFNVLQSRPAPQIISMLNQLRGNRLGYIRIWRSEANYQVEGADLPDPPPSVGMILARAQPSLAGLIKSSKVAEMTFDAGDLSVSGSKTIQVEVKE